MRVHPLASLIWLLFLAAWCLVPLHEVWGATLAWTTSATGERLVFTFTSASPAGKPRKVGGTRILVPIPKSFWKKERAPRMPGNVPDSALFRGLEIYRDGLGLKIGGPFEFSASADARDRTLVIDLRDPRRAARAGTAPPDEGSVSRSDAANASAVTASVDSLNATDQGSVLAPNATVGPDAQPVNAAPAVRSVSRRVGPGQAFRSGVARPGQSADTIGPDAGGQSSSAPGQAPGEMFRVRQPIARVLPEELRTQADSEPARSGPAANQTDAGLASPMAVVSASRQDVDRPVVTAANASAGPAAVLPDGGSGQAALPVADGAAARHDDINATSETGAPSEQTAHAVVNATLAANATAANATDMALVEGLRDQLALAQQALADDDLTTSRDILHSLLPRPDLPDDLREDALFLAADILMREGKSDLAANFPKILEAYEAAMHYDPPARRLPEALATIGYLHLVVGNAPEAKGYFDYLLRRFPDDPRVPMIDYYWGEYHAARGALQKAADHFQYVLGKYPGSAAAEASEIGLLKCLSDLGYTDKAYEMVGRIEKQWPGSYLRYPAFLMAAGYAAMTTDHLDQARDYFWKYYNLYPKSEDVDLALVRIGDIFVKAGKHGAARDIFQKVATEYANKEGGLIAQMRLAEEGLLTPSTSAPRPPDLDPEAVYKRILKDPHGSLAPVARLKLAMWHLWNKRYDKALAEAGRFAEDYPEHDLLPKNREVQDKAIREWILDSLGRGDSPTLIKAWDQYGHLLREGELDPKIRLAVATAMLSGGQMDRGLEMAKPLVFAKPRGAYAEQGLDLVLARLVEAKRWREVVDATREASTWSLPPDKQRLLDYTAALAHENLDEHQESKKLWAKLSTDMSLPEDRRVYALYFLARDAMAAGDVERAGILAQDTLNLLVKDKTDVPKIKDCLEMLIRAAEASGRDRDALSWILQYDEYISETDPNWPAFTYRKALLYKKLGEQAKWREIVQGMIAKNPDNLYSRMGASELEGMRLEQETQKFR